MIRRRKNQKSIIVSQIIKIKIKNDLQKRQKYPDQTPASEFLVFLYEGSPTLKILSEYFQAKEKKYGCTSSTP